MTNKVKKVARTVSLPQEIWDYIDTSASYADRKPNQEIEHIIKQIKNIRTKTDKEAIKLAVEGIQRLEKDQLLGKASS